MPWPKGKPRKTDDQPAPAPQASPEKVASTSTAKRKPLRQGGKTALQEESRQLEAQEQEAAPETEDRYGNPEEGEVLDEYQKTQEYVVPDQPPVEAEAKEEVSASAESTEESETQEEPTETEGEKAAIRKMHEATQNASNLQKVMDELAQSGAIDWSKISMDAPGAPAKTAESGNDGVQPPPVDLMLTDYPAWASKMKEYVGASHKPETEAQINQQLELSDIRKEFKQEIEGLPGDFDQNWNYLIAIGQSQAGKNPTYLNKSYREQYDISLPKFREATKHLKQKQNTIKKPTVESPATNKERAAAKGEEKPLTWKDVEADRMDYVKQRQATLRKLKGLS